MEDVMLDVKGEYNGGDYYQCYYRKLGNDEW